MTQLGKYEILEELGKGGFGVVYRALDITLQVERALKVLHPTLTADPQVAARFMREAQVAAGLEHSHIVPVYDIGESDGRTYLAMKYMAGGSLKDRLAAEDKLSYHQALDIMRQVSEGLEVAHQKNIVHRDLKPGNILFDDRGQIRVSDFGFAKVLSEAASTSLTMSGGILGTPAYMAPELWNGTPPPSPATDVYALACVLYEILTGEVLFDGDTPAAVMLKHFQPLPNLGQKLAQYPSTIRQAIEKALAKDPLERYQGAESFIEALIRSQKPPEPKVRAQPKQAIVRPPIKFAPQDGGSRRSPDSTQLEKDNKKANQKQELLPGWGLLMTGVALVFIGFLFLIGQISPGLLSRDRGRVPAVAIKPTATAVAQDNTLMAEPTLGIGSKVVNPVDAALMVYVPAGEFLMGSEDEDADWIEKPQHKVWLDAFWIYQHPVTNAEYRACVDAGECRVPFDNYYANLEYEDHPVVSMPWFYADAYCQWAGGRLPTEAEWEKAARGTDGRWYPWGDQKPTCSLANHKDCVGGTSPVGSYPSGASPYGALDMTGNVWEWVADWFDADYYSISPDENPIGPTIGDYRVIRGGSWYALEGLLRVSNRSSLPPDVGYSVGGFRCLRREEP